MSRLLSWGFGLGLSFLSIISHLAIAATVKADRADQHLIDNKLPTDWHKRAAFYEIFVRSYKDSNGDGIGDLNGITASLDDLQALGVTGIWLMPIHPSVDNDHGYAVNDYRAVHGDYGTMADFDHLVKESHKRGIGIILDYVINHAGSDHAYFQDAALSPNSPYRDWFIFQPKGDWDEYVWHWRANPKGEGVYYGVFDTTMPDWNLRNEAVFQFHADNLRFWMDRGVDGFRFDAVTMLYEDGPKAFFNHKDNPGFVERLRRVIEERPNKYMVCEASEGAEIYAKACQNAFAFGAQGAIIGSVRSGRVSTSLVGVFNNPLRDQLPLVLQSHDAYVGDRLFNQFGANGLDNYKISVAIQILASSTSFTYYGEEVGMSNSGRHDDIGLRSPMSFDDNPLNAGFSTVKPYRKLAKNAAHFNLKSQKADPKGLWGHYQQLFLLKKNHAALGKGRFILLSKPDDELLIFARVHGNERLIVGINLSSKPQKMRVPVLNRGQKWLNLIESKSSSYIDKSVIEYRLEGKSYTVFGEAKGDLNLNHQ